MNILFRADSSSSIGIGHIMRDLVLATQFKDSNIIFASQKLEGDIIDKIPFQVEIIISSTSDELIELIKKFNIDMVVFDHYGIDYGFEKEIKDKIDVKILSFDDTYEKHYCDYLLNQNIHADINKYVDLVNSSCSCFCGVEYALIRDEFRDIKSLNSKKTKNNIPNILITLGGADPDNITLDILKVLENIEENFVIKVVIGGSNIHKQTIIDFALFSKNEINIIVDTNNMAKLIYKSDFVISAAGTTAIELLYMNVPFFVLSIAPNQDDMYYHLIEHKLANDFKKFEYKNLLMNTTLKIATKSIAKEIA